jgi:hypothetical protein
MLHLQKYVLNLLAFARDRLTNAELSRMMDDIRRPTIETEVLHGFPQALQEVVGLVP